MQKAITATLATVFLSLGILGTAQAVSPTRQGAIIFDRLVELSHIRDVAPDTRVIVADVPGSYTNQTRTIYIAREDIKFCGHDAMCIAFIVGHELGHNVLGHTRGHNYLPKWQELDADLYSIKLMHLAGYDPCAGIGFFKKVLSQFGNDGGDQHPDNKIRIGYMEHFCHVGNIPAPQKPWNGVPDAQNQQINK
jgi:hypothetical protein